MLSLSQKVSVWLLTLLFVASGCLHLVHPAPFLAIMPPLVPKPDWMVAISGVAQILGGIGISIRATRPFAGWGLVALLVCVFPANIYMAQKHISPAGVTIPPLLLWARLLLQPLLIWWVLAACLTIRRKTGSTDPYHQ